MVNGNNMTDDKTIVQMQEEIKILTKEGDVKPMSDCVDYPLPPGGIEKYYLCYASNLKEKTL